MINDRLRWDETVLKSMKMIQAKTAFAVRGRPTLWTVYGSDCPIIPG